MYVTSVTLPISMQLAWIQSIQPTAEMLSALSLKIQNFDTNIEEHILKELDFNVVDDIKLESKEC